jgi:hypothetical protein
VGSSDAYYRNVARYRIVEFVIRQAELGDAEGIAACLRAAFEPYRDAYTVGAFEDTVPSLMVVERRFEFMQMFVAVTGSGDAVGTIGYSVAGDEDTCAGWQCFLSGRAAALHHACLPAPKPRCESRDVRV